MVRDENFGMLYLEESSRETVAGRIMAVMTSL